ncbi:hypothetical protein WM15_23865 [Burkholderia ubonensis]|nr:hypothetical protein WM15_23865 [Burkholderia ubonensis]
MQIHAAKADILELLLQLNPFSPSLCKFVPHWFVSCLPLANYLRHLFRRVVERQNVIMRIT